MMFGTAKRLYAQSNLRVSYKEHVINFVSRYKYLGVTMDQSLNMNDHLLKTLKNMAVGSKIVEGRLDRTLS